MASPRPRTRASALPTAAYPYLTTVRYDTPNPLPWHLEVSLHDLAARLGYPGTLQQVSISDAGPSGRALTVELAGTAGAQQVDGHRFAQSLGLRSTLFTPTVGTASSAPPPPGTSGDTAQALPDDAAALSRAANSGDLGPAGADGFARRLLAANRDIASERLPPLRTAVDLTHEAATWLALVALVVVTMAARLVSTAEAPRFARAQPVTPELPEAPPVRLRLRRRT